MGIHRKSGRKSGNLDPKSGRPKQSGTIGRPPVPDFSQKVKKSALKKSGIAIYGIWNKLFH
jgi:hypothetical protein